jgi:hypothetical protein
MGPGVRRDDEQKRGLGKGALSVVPTIFLQLHYQSIGTRRFAHPTKPEPVA